MDWEKAIRFVQEKQEKSEDFNIRLIWKRLQTGDRTTELLQTIIAINGLENDATSSSPEWNAAIKWLTWQRAQASNLMLDMLWAQLETGNRTPELLSLIRQQTTQAPSPPPPVVVIVSPPPEPEGPPTADF